MLVPVTSWPEFCNETLVVPDRFRSLVVAVTMWVWFAEAMNTAFEHVCDVVSPELNVSVQRAKDVAAGAVLVSAAGAAALGALVFWPYVAPFVWRIATGIGICTGAA